MVLTVSFALSLVIGLFVTVAGGNASANLTPASRRQDHTTSPSASVPFVSSTSTSTASRPAFVTIAIRPSSGTRRESRYSCFYRRVKLKFGNSEIHRFGDRGAITL
jgi:hypothetical protein